MTTLWDLIKKANEKKELELLTSVELIQKRKSKFNSKAEYYSEIIKTFLKENKINFKSLNVKDDTYDLTIDIDFETEDDANTVVADNKTFKWFAKWITCKMSRVNSYEQIEDNSYTFFIRKKDDDYNFSNEDYLKSHEIDLSKEFWYWLDPKKVEEMVWKDMKFYDDYCEDPNRPRRITINKIFSNNKYEEYEEGEVMIELQQAIAINWTWVAWNSFPQYIMPINNLVWYKFYDMEFRPYFGQYEED